MAQLDTNNQEILLTARCCGKTLRYDRSIDPTIPLNVVKIEQPSCDDHWNGDREDETWFDANGREVSSKPYPRCG